MSRLTDIQRDFLDRKRRREYDDELEEERRRREVAARYERAAKGEQVTAEEAEKWPIGRKIKAIVDYVKANRDAYTPDFLEEKLLFKVEGEELLNSLRNNPKISHLADSNSYCYKPEVEGVDNRDDLLELIARHPQGFKEETLKDAYIGVTEDIQKLIEEEVVERISSRLFFVPIDARGDVDPAFKQMWTDMKLPSDIPAALQKLGLPSLQRPSAKVAAAQKLQRSRL